jgi:hypothetical protein
LQQKQHKRFLDSRRKTCRSLGMTFISWDTASLSPP